MTNSQNRHKMTSGSKACFHGKLACKWKNGLLVRPTWSTREVKDGLAVALEGIGEGEADLICGGKVIGTVKFGAGSILEPEVSEAFAVGETGERVTVKVVVKKGTVTLKKVKFAY